MQIDDLQFILRSRTGAMRVNASNLIHRQRRLIPVLDALSLLGNP